MQWEHGHTDPISIYRLPVLIDLIWCCVRVLQDKWAFSAELWEISRSVQQCCTHILHGELSALHEDKPKGWELSCNAAAQTAKSLWDLTPRDVPLQAVFWLNTPGCFNRLRPPGKQVLSPACQCGGTCNISMSEMAGSEIISSRAR